MTHLAYLLSLCAAIGCLYLIDRRYKVAIAYNHVKSARVLFGGIVFFAVWDIAGIITKVFYTGKTTYLTGITLIHDFPIEELFFLTLLMYTALLSYKIIGKYV